MESAWTEVQQICDTNPNKVSPVSALCWDPYHELLWVGNDTVSIGYFFFKKIDSLYSPKPPIIVFYYYY